jgi:hypothetical protein
MTTKTLRGRQPDAVTQFSIFTANRMGRLHDLIALLSSNSVHVLAVTVWMPRKRPSSASWWTIRRRRERLLRENSFRLH